MQKTERLLAITLLLQARGKMTAKHLATILGVSTRTIYRDIDILSLAHIPVSMDYGPGGGYFLPDDFHFESAIFTREEAVSLVLSADMAGNYSLFADDDELQRALFKLEATLPEKYRNDVQQAREHILFDTGTWYSQPKGMPTYLETIRLAVLGALQLDILYPCDTRPGMQWRRVEPYGLVFKGLPRQRVRVGIWYLVAFCHSCREICAFRVGYIEQLNVGQDKATIPPDFDLKAYWQKARIQLEEQQSFTFLLHVAPPARSGLPGDYTLLNEEAEGGAIIRVNVESFAAAVAYTLALGMNATVVSPLEVREAVADMAKGIAKMYGM
ncbi:MAG TPA: WYL domain-containing protein [Ktedonobacteraceae bacterium]|nr:WYL domain-containing protein [Ktedonobacteraceae bacterium]